jgi:hypothetical protein
VKLVEYCADSHDFLLISVPRLLFDYFLGFLLLLNNVIKYLFRYLKKVPTLCTKIAEV